jgi:hypothetical protein
MIANDKFGGFGRKQSWPSYKVLDHFLGGTEENNEKLQSG